MPLGQRPSSLAATRSRVEARLGDGVGEEGVESDDVLGKHAERVVRAVATEHLRLRNGEDEVLVLAGIAEHQRACRRQRLVVGLGILAETLHPRLGDAVAVAEVDDAIGERRPVEP